MRPFTIPMLCAFMLFALGTAARANILSLQCGGETGGCDDFGMVMGPTGGTLSSVSCSGTQSTTVSTSGSLITMVSSSSTSDPTIVYYNTVYNDPTGAPWYSYDIEVKIDTPQAYPLTSYNLSNGAVTFPVSGWSATTTQLSYVGLVGGENEYVGYVDMSGSPPINNDNGPDNELDFNYRVSFQGSTQYTETQIQWPGFAPVPEPGTLALLASGGGLVLWRLRRRWSR